MTVLSGVVNGLRHMHMPAVHTAIRTGLIRSRWTVRDELREQTLPHLARKAPNDRGPIAICTAGYALATGLDGNANAIEADQGDLTGYFVDFGVRRRLRVFARYLAARFLENAMSNPLQFPMI